MSNLRRVLRVESQVAHAVPQLEIGHAPEAPARDVRRPEAPLPSSAPQLVPEGARALLAGTAEPLHECENCGKPLGGRQERSCSGPCRAALSRQRQAEERAARDRKIRSLLVTAQRTTDDLRIRSLIAKTLRVLDGTQQAESRT